MLRRQRERRLQRSRRSLIWRAHASSCCALLPLKSFPATRSLSSPAAKVRGGASVPLALCRTALLAGGGVSGINCWNLAAAPVTALGGGTSSGIDLFAQPHNAAAAYAPLRSRRQDGGDRVRLRLP